MQTGDLLYWVLMIAKSRLAEMQWLAMPSSQWGSVHIAAAHSCGTSKLGAVLP